MVVYDRSGIGSGVTDQFLAFHFPANPTAGAPPSGETRYDINYNGTYAGAITTVLTASATTTTNPMYPANDGVPASNPVEVWQLQIRPPNSNAHQMWLNVFDLAASSAEVSTASKINVTAGAAAGTLLAAAGGNQAVLFNTGTAGSTIVGTIAYSVPAVATAHYITEVPANTGYTVTASVSAGTHTINVVPGGPLNSSTKGVLSFIVSAAGAVGPGDRIFANGFD